MTGPVGVGLSAGSDAAGPIAPWWRVVLAVVIVLYLLWAVAELLLVWRTHRRWRS